jgi:hypothetical protein
MMLQEVEKIDQNDHLAKETIQNSIYLVVIHLVTE